MKNCVIVLINASVCDFTVDLVLDTKIDRTLVNPLLVAIIIVIN